MIRTENRIDQATELGLMAGGTTGEGRDRSLEYLDDPVSEELRLRFHELSMYQIELEAQNVELRRIRGELDEARARYFNLYDLAPVGYCSLSERGLILEANLTAATLLGVAREALIRQPLTRFIHKEDHDIYYMYCKQNLPTCGQEVCELRMVKEDQTVFWAQLATSTALLAGGATECRMVITDIGKRKRTEMALRQSEQKANDAKNLLKSVLDAIPVRLFWKDLSSIFMGCNQSFAEDAGYQIPEELIGLDDYSMAWRQQAESFRRDDLEVMNSGKPKLHCEEIRTTPEGKQTWLSVSKVPLRDKNDNIIGILGAYKDITLRKRDEEELLKAQKLEALGFLAGGIAHDFNNILMAIMGNVSFAKMQLSPTDKAFERLTTAETAAAKAKDLIRQFLLFSKGGEPVITSIPTAYLIKSYTHLALSGTKSACACTIPKDLWNIEADEGQIGQALTNILMNADQAMPDGGTITVRLENVIVNAPLDLPLNNGRYVKISITDQGSGIPEEHLCEVLDPYFTTKEKGRGLGLTSAYSILKRHRGCMTVESTPGSGATFTLFIPASPMQIPVQHKEIPMKETLIRQTGRFSPHQAEWQTHKAGCIAAEICPNCGHELFGDQEVVDKDFGKTAICRRCNCNGEDSNPHQHHNKNSLPEKSPVLEIINKQIGSSSPRKKEWYQHVANCIAIEMCPECGSDIFVSEEIIDKKIGKIIYFECSTCDWKNYDYAEHSL